jgi:hypothetical protein
VNVAKQVDGALLRTAANFADRVRVALQNSVNPEAIAEAWIHNYVPGTTITSSQAREWASIHVNVNLDELNRVLLDVYGSGWVLGEDFAKSAYAHAKVNKADDPFDISSALAIDWSTWTPGHALASALLNRKGGLDSLLNRTRPTVIAGVGKTSRDRIGTVLAEAIGRGETDLTIAKSLIELNIKAIVRDPQRALSIATTEMNRAMSVATAESYKEFGLEKVEWYSLEGCEDCQANSDMGPIPLGDEFDSGDTEPPAHTNCRCSLLPVIEDASEAEKTTRQGTLIRPSQIHKNVPEQNHVFKCCLTRITRT